MSAKNTPGQVLPTRSRRPRALMASGYGASVIVGSFEPVSELKTMHRGGVLQEGWTLKLKRPKLQLEHLF